MDHLRNIVAGILAGIAAPATIGTPTEYPRPQGADMDRMRGDVLRLGQTFRAVMQQEQRDAQHRQGKPNA